MNKKGNKKGVRTIFAPQENSSDPFFLPKKIVLTPFSSLFPRGFSSVFQRSSGADSEYGSSGGPYRCANAYSIIPVIFLRCVALVWAWLSAATTMGIDLQRPIMVEPLD
jgi:hypothetical protein